MKNTKAEHPSNTVKYHKHPCIMNTNPALKNSGVQ